MHPPVAPLVPEVRLALRDLVGMVGEGVVNAAAVDVQVFAQMLHRDARAFDVPAGIADAPGGIPFQRLVLKLGFGKPEHKVIAVPLVRVLFDPLAHADVQVVRVKVVEDVIALQLRGVEIHVAAGKIGIPGVHQLADDADVFVDAVGGGLHHIRGLDVQLCAVGKERVGVELRDLHDRLVFALRALEHLVFALVGVRGQMADVGDVHDALDGIAQPAQILFKNILHDVRAQVPDMRIVIHGRPAGVHFDDVRMVGNKQLLLAACGIIEIHRKRSFSVRPPCRAERNDLIIQSALRKISRFFQRYSAPE